jgi:hypothetical protein
MHIRLLSYKLLNERWQGLLRNIVVFLLFLFSSLRGFRTVLKVCGFDFSCVGIYSFFRNSGCYYGLLVYSITFNLSLSHVSFASLIIENSLIWLEQEFLRIIVLVIFKADLTALIGETKIYFILIFDYRCVFDLLCLLITGTGLNCLFLILMIIWLLFQLGVRHICNN